MNYTWLNLVSLVCGLGAWLLPWLAVTLRRRLHAVSLLLCALAFYFQIWYGAHLVKLHDISAILDTWPAVLTVSTCLLTVTLLFNAASLWLLRTKERGKT